MKSFVSMPDTENTMESHLGSMGQFRKQDLVRDWKQFLGRAACYVG